MERVGCTLLKTVACSFTMHDVCGLLDANVEKWNGQGLRIEIRGVCRHIGTRSRVLLEDWHFVQSWSERFKVLGLFPLPFVEEHRPWPDVRYLLYEGPAEFRFWLRSPSGGEQVRPRLF